MNYLLNFIRILIILSFMIAIFLIVGTLYYMEYKLPDINALNTVQLQVPLHIFTADKKLIATFGEKHRIPLAYQAIPTPLIQAVLATEDQRYFHHPGIDLAGLCRATIQLMLTGKKRQGGSTITMQVARSFYLNRKKTFTRKIQEVLLAIKIEHKLSKEKILELYLNKVFLGNRAYGIEAAAETYYGKHITKLTLDQYAVLAGLLKAPSALNPFVNPTATKKRRNHVLARMYEQHYIHSLSYQTALRQPINASYHNLQTEIDASYVAELVRKQLEHLYGDNIYTDGFKAYTTIDSHIQKISNQAVHDQLLAYDQRHGYRGPEKNLGIPALDNMQHWEEILKEIPIINQLEPAAVIEIAPYSITVLRRNGELAILSWEGLSWARKRINANYLGPHPKSAGQILQLGDVVRLSLDLHDHTYRLAQIPQAEASLIALNPQNGAILALTGGFSYKQSKFNRVTHAERQPGSSLKPFLYSAALEKGYTLATVINDAPIALRNPTDNSLWRPQNDTHRFYGPTRLRKALIHSRNVVSIRLLNLIGIPYAIKFFENFGFTAQQLPASLSLALGTATVTPLQMAQAYSVFANGGFKTIPYLIQSIDNIDHQVIYQAKPLAACSSTVCPKNKAHALRVLSAENAFLITSALHDVIQRGTALLARNLQRNDLAGKTGTTQNQIDAWFAGYNHDLVAVTWMGFDQPQSLHEYAARAALPMWIQFMESTLKNKPESIQEQPSGILSIRIDPKTGQRTTSRHAASLFEYFMQPYLPEKFSPHPSFYPDNLDEQENNLQEDDHSPIPNQPLESEKNHNPFENNNEPIY